MNRIVFILSILFILSVLFRNRIVILWKSRRHPILIAEDHCKFRILSQTIP